MRERFGGILAGFCFLLMTPALAQQEGDLGFEPEVASPAFEAGAGPLILIDEAHHNFHILEGRYQAFAQLLEADGFRVAASTAKFSHEALRDCEILVIANALSAENSEWGNWSLPTSPAFTFDEVIALRDWVEAGGALLLIVDHMPMPGCNRMLAEAFGVHFSNGYSVRQEAGWHISFSRENGLLHDHVITRGASGDERISVVASFTGSAFLAGDDMSPLMVLPDDTESYLPRRAGEITENTPRMNVGGWLQGGARNFGEGRIAVFGEAAMFTAQVVRDGDEVHRFGFIQPEAEDNQQFLLNICRWLAGALDG